ncbi:Dabb family protein [Streptomyces sp. NPDC058701]|uniref:Dabb family protein n=1 Tax=Streptomyces sp. NPDC058701 TaxID=3346608 RepID=UPI00364E05E4
MIHHIVLFRLKPGITWDSPEARAAEELQERMGEEIEELRAWTCGRNVSDRPAAYDYAVLGLLDDEDALALYLAHPFHRRAAEAWTALSDRVLADIPARPTPSTTPLPHHPEGDPRVRTR